MQFQTRPIGTIDDPLYLKNLGRSEVTVYNVLNLGCHSFIEEQKLVDPALLPIFVGIERYLSDQNYYHTFYPVQWKDYRSMHDSNVIANGYNDHFLFEEKYDAEQYLQIALLDKKAEEEYNRRRDRLRF